MSRNYSIDMMGRVLYIKTISISLSLARTKLEYMLTAKYFAP